MSAGTLTLTNNSVAVKGAGTAFTSDLKPGDMIVAVVGGVTYTLPVKTVDSATQVTLIRVYEGPTQAGAAWSAVPRETRNNITAQMAADISFLQRAYIYDRINWQQVFSGTGNITVKLPDGSTFTGPAWNSFITELNKKADMSAFEFVGNTSAGYIKLPQNIRIQWLQTPGGIVAGGSGVGYWKYPFPTQCLFAVASPVALSGATIASNVCAGAFSNTAVELHCWGPIAANARILGIGL